MVVRVTVDGVILEAADGTTTLLLAVVLNSNLHNGDDFWAQYATYIVVSSRPLIDTRNGTPLVAIDAVGERTSKLPS
jgi:hypothetical protein